MKPLLVATAFLTRIPVRVEADGKDVGGAARWFPLVGAGLGAVGALIARGFDNISFPPPLGAVLLVALGAWVTGAIHFDGLADMADGFGGGRGGEEVLRIMRDPLIGSFGATTLVLVTFMKVGALAALLERQAAGEFLVAAPALSRWTIVALGAWLPYARAEGGLGQAVTRDHGTRGIIWATAVAGGVTIAALGANGLIFWAVALLVMVAIGRTARRRIGGVTGDVFGASVELTETAVLIAAVFLTGPS